MLNKKLSKITFQQLIDKVTKISPENLIISTGTGFKDPAGNLHPWLAFRLENKSPRASSIQEVTLAITKIKVVALLITYDGKSSTLSKPLKDTTVDDTAQFVISALLRPN